MGRIREIVKGDFLWLFDFENSPDQRKYSFNKQITITEHYAWFMKRLGKHRVFIMLDRDKRIGAFSLKEIDGKEYINIGILPEYQSMGYGSICLTFAKSRLSSSLYAVVLKENIVSQKLFETNDFYALSEDKETITYHVTKYR